MRFIIYIVVFLSSCTIDKPLKNRNIISGEIEMVCIDQVHRKRDWCRKTLITFTLKLNNWTNDSVKISKFKGVNYCSIEESNEILKIKSKYDSIILKELDNKTEKFRLTIIERKEKLKKIISPQSSIYFECALLTSFSSLGLREIIDLYKPLFESNFVIESDKVLDSNRLIVFNKSKKFKVVLKEDDKVVLMKDALKRKPRITYIIPRGATSQKK